MSRLWATAYRVLRQIRRDPRTIAMMVGIPSILLIITKYVFNSEPAAFQLIGVPLCGMLPLLLMFLIASITMLRERTSGTLERLMTLPIRKIDLLAGYALAFGFIAVIQATIVCGVGFLLLGLDSPHGIALPIVFAVANAMLGMSLGLFVSAFARSEFQAVQFMPAFIFPQLFTCGLFVARAKMAGFLDWFSTVMPLTYSYDALERLSSSASYGGYLIRDGIIIAGFVIGLLLLGATTLRRTVR